DIVAGSAQKFRSETTPNGRVIRSYGMSFVNRIVTAATEIDPRFVRDLHAGPSSPPNFTYSLFLKDSDSRRAGDIAVFGILSSSVPAMAAQSNSSWLFEQPAPFTYPVYWPDGDKLRAVEPFITSAQQQRDVLRQPALRDAWYEHMSREDGFFGSQTFGFPLLDISPFARLVRRTLAISSIDRAKSRILKGTEYPYAEVLRLMIVTFAERARADGQIPVVFLIQSRDARDVDLLSIAHSTLVENNIDYVATAEIVDPRDRSLFLLDSHYKPEIDKLFAQRFVDLMKF
ncbi:MAG: hypothetical protein AAF862_14580, partial [Pseudomonadota bacterium]